MKISNETYIIHIRLELYSHGMSNANVFDSTDIFLHILLRRIFPTYKVAFLMTTYVHVCFSSSKSL